MKLKVIALAISTLGLTACETMQAKKEEPKVQVKERIVEKIVYKQPSNIVVESAPAWMYKIPKEPGVVFASASSRSQDYSMAMEKAKTLAQAKIAEMLGTKVDKQTKIFQTDKNGNYSDSSQTAIRKSIEDVNLLGVEVVDMKVLLEGPNIYRAFVLMGLKLEEQKPEVKEEAKKEIDEEKKAFDELGKKKPEPKKEQVSSNGVIVTPVASLDRSRMVVNTISDQSVKDRVNEVLKDPNAVVINATVR